MMTKLPTLKDYYDTIKKLPLKKKYTKEDLLTPDLFIDNEGNIELYYAAHNECINKEAKIFMIGITPGFAQMERSIHMCRQAIEEGLDLAQIPYMCKKEGRFSGVLRKNIAQMLDELGLNQYLNLFSTKALFEEADNLLHTTSLIPFPTFVKGKNYTGHSPELIKNKFLMSYMETNMEWQIEILKDALYIPMGKCVEEILKMYIEEGKLKESQCLLGFPHPSGANVNRMKQLEEEKEQMMIKIRAFYL